MNLKKACLITLSSIFIPTLAFGADQVKLRSSYMDLSVSQVYEIPGVKIFEKKKWGFYGYSTIQHNYELKIINSDRVVVDHTTGLMWHPSGSEEKLVWRAAKEWVVKLNNRRYAGYKDWRLPTLEEAASLLESEPIFGRYIVPVFDNLQPSIWTGDTKSGGYEAWFVSFNTGSVSWLGIIRKSYVRTVRSIKGTNW